MAGMVQGVVVQMMIDTFFFCKEGKVFPISEIMGNFTKIEGER